MKIKIKRTKLWIEVTESGHKVVGVDVNGRIRKTRVFFSLFAAEARLRDHAKISDLVVLYKGGYLSAQGIVETGGTRA